MFYDPLADIVHSTENMFLFKIINYKFTLISNDPQYDFYCSTIIDLRFVKNVINKMNIMFCCQVDDTGPMGAVAGIEPTRLPSGIHNLPWAPY